MLADHRDGLSSSSFLAWSSIAQSVCQRAFSLLAIWCLRPRVQILHSAEEHNLSPFDLNIAWLCQSIEINNNKHVCMHVCMYIYTVYAAYAAYIVKPRTNYLPSSNVDIYTVYRGIWTVMYVPVWVCQATSPQWTIEGMMLTHWQGHIMRILNPRPVSTPNWYKPSETSRYIEATWIIANLLRCRLSRTITCQNSRNFPYKRQHMIHMTSTIIAVAPLWWQI